VRHLLGGGLQFSVLATVLGSVLLVLGCTGVGWAWIRRLAGDGGR